MVSKIGNFNYIGCEKHYVIKFSLVALQQKKYESEEITFV